MPRGVYKRIIGVNCGKGINIGTTGKETSTETRRKLSLAYKDRHCSEETRKKLSKANKGKHLSLETRKKLSEIHKGHKVLGETKKKISKHTKGEKHHNWQGGKSFEPYSVDWTDILRESIRERDNRICQLCGIHQDELKGFFKKLDVHHKDYNKDNLNPENLISLCRSCHMKTNTNKDYWINYFQRAILDT